PADFQLQFAVGIALPAAFPFFLVFPLFRETNTGLGFHVVKPGVFHPFTGGPDVFAGDGASVATDTLIQIQHHANLCSYFHRITSLQPYWVSSQSTLFILRTTTNSSRLQPTVP